MDINLIKAVFAAGYLIGYKQGEDHAISFEWGCGGGKPDVEKVWREDIEGLGKDIFNIKDWEDFS